MKTSSFGFSLIEVALALVVAAGGLLSVFSLFPLGLRQSSNAKGDLTQFTFANTVLESIAGNVAQIDDIAKWNDPEEWWEIAVAGTGLPGRSQLISGQAMYKKYKDAENGGDWGSGFPSIATAEIARGDQSPTGKAWYVGQELDESKEYESDQIWLPPQYLIRIFQVESRPPFRFGDVVKEEIVNLPIIQKSGLDSNTEVFRPCRYVVSLISSDRFSPNIFTHEPIYSQEFYFLHRP